MITEDSYKINLNMVKEMILDEEKLVSYVTLSKDLCIHVNNSKQLLCSAAEKIREDQPDVQLNINYVISGISDSNTAITTICTESELAKLKESLSDVFFYHVYSVCKGSPDVDHVALLLLNKYEDYSLCPGLIRNKECIKRTADEIGSLKSNSQEAVVLETKPVIVSNKKIKQEPKQDSETSKNVLKDETKPTKRTETKPHTNIKVDPISPSKESSNKQNVQKTNGPKAQKGIASFFNKSNGLQTNKLTNSTHNKNVSNGLPNKKPSNGPVVKKCDDEKMDIDIEDSEIEKEVVEEKVEEKVIKESIEKKAIKKETGTKSKEEKKAVKKEIETKSKEKKPGKKESESEENKSLNKIKKSSKVDKKRKRVLLVSDSESDEDNNPFADNQEPKDVKMNESDDEIPPTPLANSIKITSGIVNPKKRRKVVDKTYTDEEGYVLTKKVEVYESCSETENDDTVNVEKETKHEKEEKKVEVSTNNNKKNSPKKNSPKKSKKKISPPQKGKQPTLNSFFKRK